VSDPVLVAGAVALCGAFVSAARAASDHERTLIGLGAVRTMPEPKESRFARDRVLAVALVAGGATLGVVVAGVPGGIIGAASCIGARAVTRRKSSKRRSDLLEAQLADAVSAISAALRAGLSLSQALSYAGGETEAPLGETLQRASRRESLGEPLDRALDRWADEVGSDDARLVNGVLSLHRRTGGDLPRVLDRVAETLRERREMAREVRTLTAQARLSGAILGLLPIGFFLFLLVTSRKDIAAAFETPVGISAVGLGLVMQGAAFVWIRRLLRVG
jgi:tight adherence protein B